MTPQITTANGIWRKWLSDLLKVGGSLLLAAAILWWMYRGFQWEQLSEALSGQMRWTWMLLSFPFGILAQVLRAMRWKQALAPIGERPRLHTCANAVFLSYASSLIIPRVGEMLRCGVLKRWEGTNFSHSLGTVVTERVVDVVIVLLISFFTMLTQIPVFLTFFRKTGVSIDSFLASFTTAGYLVTMVCCLLILGVACFFINRLNVLSRTKAVLKDLTAGLLSVRQVKSPALFLVYSVGIWACYYLHFYLTFYCFDYTEGLGAISALVAFVVGTFAVLVPTPNGAGPWHFAVKTVLILYGVQQADAVLYVLIVHTLQTLLVLALGVYAVAALALTHRK